MHQDKETLGVPSVESAQATGENPIKSFSFYGLGQVESLPPPAEAAIAMRWPLLVVFRGIGDEFSLVALAFRGFSSATRLAAQQELLIELSNILLAKFMLRRSQQHNLCALPEALGSQDRRYERLLKLLNQLRSKRQCEIHTFRYHDEVIDLMAVPMRHGEA